MAPARLQQKFRYIVIISQRIRYLGANVMWIRHSSEIVNE